MSGVGASMENVRDQLRAPTVMQRSVRCALPRVDVRRLTTMQIGSWPTRRRHRQYAGTVDAPKVSIRDLSNWIVPRLQSSVFASVSGVPHRDRLKCGYDH